MQTKSIIFGMTCAILLSGTAIGFPRGSDPALPQCGHSLASVETLPPQSSHCLNATAGPPREWCRR